MSDNGPNWQDFTAFGRRLTLRGTLRAETGLRVGSGQADDISGADMAVMKDDQRRPYIPGSSFKGALRAHVERLVRSLWPEPDTRRAACDPLTETGRCIPGRWPASQELPVGLRTIAELREEAGDSPTALADLVWKHSCRVCRVFGSPWLASKVLFRDVSLSNPALWVEARYQVRAGVGIERDSEAAAEGVLYSGETVPPRTEFAWEIVLENADPQTEEPLLFLGLREMMNQHVPLGGARSRGLGRVSLTVDEISLIDGNNRSALLDYLTRGKLQTPSWEELESRIEECVKGVYQGRRN
jgi:CRISPR-associated RAMP protein (TIGR02581 family)